MHHAIAITAKVVIEMDRSTSILIMVFGIVVSIIRIIKKNKSVVLSASANLFRQFEIKTFLSAHMKLNMRLLHRNSFHLARHS